MEKCVSALAEKSEFDRQFSWLSLSDEVIQATVPWMAAALCLDSNQQLQPHPVMTNNTEVL